MDWYVASLLLSKSATRVPSGIHLLRRCHYLITGMTPDDGYRKAVELGRNLTTARKATTRQGTPEVLWVFRGICELVMVHEPVQDRTELVWTQTELTSEELERQVRQKEDLTAFRVPGGATPSGWYVANVVMYEVHEDGTHDGKFLVWVNSLLIQATDADSAFLKCLTLGHEQETTAGSHRCDGDSAHWQLKGIAELFPVHDAPRDCGLLWCEDFEADAEKLRGMVPEKSELAVFKWLAARDK